VLVVNLSSRHQGVFYAQTALLIPLILTTVIAAAIGGGEGFMLTKMSGGNPASGGGGAEHAAPAPAPAHAPAPADAHGAKPKEGAKDEHGKPAAAPAPTHGIVVRELPPIVTNIAIPGDVWIRLETSLVYEAADLKNPDVAIKEISGDILTYLRTVSLPEVQGARGLRHLRDDLNERVALRTEGKAKELLIQGMVVQ
jgi:flagellar FliL protein